MTVVGVVAVFMLALAGPALAHHDHQPHNPEWIAHHPCGVQNHDDGRGNKFHGAAHIGAATTQDPVTGLWILGQGHSVVSVAGGSC